MIPCCRGCEWEFDKAIRGQDNEGLYLATTKEECGIWERKHFFIRMVNDKGRVIIE